MSSYIVDALGRPIPQSSPDSPAQVKNNAGGYSFKVTDRERLLRFLVLGAEGGTYYVSERDLLKSGTDAVVREIHRDGRGTVDAAVAVSVAGRAPKNDPALFVLALAAKKGDDATRAYARGALPRVARTLSHLYKFASYVDKLGGWGRGTRKAVASWFQGKETRALAYQCVKYKAREGWAIADLLRLSHPRPNDRDHELIYRWAVSKEANLGEGGPGLDPIRAARALLACVREGQVAEIVRHFGVPREAVPSQWLKSPEVWDALLTDMPLGALLRNLGNLGKCGLLTPGSAAEATVTERLADPEVARRARLHPLAFLNALTTYGGGHSIRGHGEWTPCQPVVDALDAGFYSSFGNVDPSGGRVYLALDVSGSMMAGEVAGLPGLSPLKGAVAMAMVTAAAEKQCMIFGFSDGMTELRLSPGRRLDDNLASVTGLPFQGTDCALPIIHAGIRGLEVDTFVVYTDNETWAGKMHPHRALEHYRDAYNPKARLVVVGMTSTEFTIADPDDAGMLDVVGFDTAAPQAIAEFSKGLPLDKEPPRL